MKAKIFISGEIGVDFKYIDLISQIRKYDVVTEMEVVINSVGGYVDEGIDIYNYLRGMQIPITTVASGVCASIATVIYLAGDKRSILEGTKFMIHAPKIDPEMYLSSRELKDFSDSLAKVEKDMISIYTERTKMQPDEVSRLIQEDTYMTVEQLDSLGFTTQTEIEPLRAVAKLNINQISMTTEDKNWLTDQLKSLAKMFAGRAKMLSLQDATGVTVEFAGLEDNDIPKVGDTATVDGQPANGVYVMPSLNNASVTFVDGVVTLIQEASSEDDEIELLKAENAELKQKVDEYEKAQMKLQEEFKNFRSQVVSKMAKTDPTPAPKGTPNPQPERPTAKYLDNLKKIRK